MPAFSSAASDSSFSIRSNPLGDRPSGPIFPSIAMGGRDRPRLPDGLKCGGQPLQAPARMPLIFGREHPLDHPAAARWLRVSPARGPPTVWGELVQIHDDRDVFQASLDALPVIDIHSL